MQPAVPINFFAILLCVIAAVVLGSLWYGPLFGKPWMKMIKLDMPKKMTPAVKKMMMKSYALQTLGSILMAFVMAHSMVFAMSYLGITGVAAGLQGGFWNWLHRAGLDGRRDLGRQAVEALVHQRGLLPGAPVHHGRDHRADAAGSCRYLGQLRAFLHPESLSTYVYVHLVDVYSLL